MSNRLRWVTTCVEAARMVWAIRSRGWSRRSRAPFPDRTYLQWRSYTAYGDPDTSIAYSDLRTFLAWRKSFRRYIREIR